MQKLIKISFLLCTLSANSIWACSKREAEKAVRDYATSVSPAGSKITIKKSGEYYQFKGTLIDGDFISNSMGTVRVIKNAHGKCEVKEKQPQVQSKTMSSKKKVQK